MDNATQKKYVCLLVLWKLAQDGDFSPSELESLRSELHHFETRLNKMHHLETELRMVDERHGEAFVEDEKTEGRKIMDRKLRKHADEIEKMEMHLKRTIAARHSEL